MYTVGSEKLFCKLSNLLKSMSPRRNVAYSSKGSSNAPDDLYFIRSTDNGL